MSDPLAVLIRLADWRIDARQRTLADARRALAAVTEAHDGLTAEMAGEAVTAAGDAHTLAAWGAYAARCRQRMADLAGEIETAEACAAVAQADLRAEFAAGKRLHILFERRERERRAEIAHREQAALDDLAQRRPAPLQG